MSVPEALMLAALVVGVVVIAIFLVSHHDD